MKNRVDQPFTADNTAPQPQQVGAGARFIDKHEPGRVKHELLSPPAAAPRPARVVPRRAGYLF
jgi:hypothetical protein